MRILLVRYCNAFSIEVIRFNIVCFLQKSLLDVLFDRVGQIEESIFEVAAKMDVSNLVGGGSTDIRFAAFEMCFNKIPCRTK